MVKIKLPVLLERGTNALFTTMLVAAAFHLSIGFFAAGVSRNWDYISPIDFLGLGVLFPQYVHSLIASGIAWAILVALFFVLLYFHAYLLVAINPRWRRLPYIIRIGDESKDILRRQAKRTAKLAPSEEK